MDPIELNLFSNRVSSICDEMGVVLRRAAFSPNIKERLDFSCALFGPDGGLFAQAAHIPVHLGSMAFAMADIVGGRQWRRGDMLVLNDPFLGGTHLPDVTVIAPVFLKDDTHNHSPLEGESVKQGRSPQLNRWGANDKNTHDSDKPLGFVANRAHHADIGCDTPGSMPVSASLEEEGIIIPPTWLLRGGEVQEDALRLLQLPTASGDDQGQQLSGDFAAQVGANRIGVQRLQALIQRMGAATYLQAMAALNDYGDRIMQGLLQTFGDGHYRFADVLDDDGQGSTDIPLALTLSFSKGEAVLDFAGSAKQVPGNLNCPLSVAAAAAFYCFRCLLPPESPSCAGLFRRIHLRAPAGSIVNARRPAAVAAGNVETSMRLVDLIFGALAQALPDKIPAASQGTMNNIAMGHKGNRQQPRWNYYETLAGGMGGGPQHPGLDAAHSHMTNTLNTPIESLELHYPLRVHRYAIRRNDSKGSSRSQGAKASTHKGGCGISREYEFLAPAHLSLLTERRRHSPWNIGSKADSAEPGQNLLNNTPLPAKCSLQVKTGDRLTINTPNGGSWSAS